MKKPIRLGLMSPMTGLVGLYGQEIVTAAQIACAEINQSGGILGRPLELVIEDDGSLPDTALKAAVRLLDEHRCSALIGNLLSNSRIAVVTQVAEPRQVPLLNFSFYEGSISSRYFFNFAALPNQQIDKMIPFMARRFGLKMFFAGNNYEWPRGSIDAAKHSLRALDGDVVGERYLPLGASVEDIDRMLVEVALSGADVFVPYFAGQDQLTLLARFSAAGLKPRMAVVMGHFDEMLASQLAPDVREGLYSSNTYFMSLDTEGNRHYQQQLAGYPGITGLWPDGNGVLTNFGEGTYLCVKAFAQAAEAAGTTGAEGLISALEHTRLSGPQGIVEMDATTHHARVNSVLACCDGDGSFRIIQHFGQIPPQIPDRYQARTQPAVLRESPPSPTLAGSLAEKMAGAQLRVATAQHILSIADMAIIASDSDGLIRESNRSAQALFGYREDELLGLSVHQLLPPHFRQRHAELFKAFVEGEESERRMSGRNEVVGYRKDGSFFPLEASIAKFHDGDNWLLVVTMRDITERKRAEEELTHRATHDTLTGLPNRALIRERLGNALQRSRRSGESVALLFLDLDGFKPINDTHGHEAGDALLQAIASRLLEQVRPGDTVARLAGDEFVVLCEKVDQPIAMSLLAVRINDIVRQPVHFQGTDLFVTGSVGVAIGNGNTHSADDLLRYADTAMYTVKEHGRDGWQFFSETLQEQAQQRLTIINGLRSAIERQELSALFQPIVNAETGRIVGAELLLRWHPASGPVSPAVFIPVAEMTGTIVPIGLWVFREACRAEAEWRHRWGEAAPYVSVNVSARQLNEDSLVDEFSAILRETGANPANLLLEITETSLMADVETNLRILRRLADLGLRVAVDDFGTGYSSLAQLTRLPVNVLKIDRAFVDSLEKSEESRTIIRAVIGIGRSLNLKLVAEGVETAGQRRELCTYGCDLIQGYYFHRPLTEQAFTEAFEREGLQADGANDTALHFLIYVSHSRLPMSEEDVTALMRQFQLRNRRNGISGCLIHKDGEFMQLLEGHKEAVLALCDRIRADGRHADFRVVTEGPLHRRTFTDWGMVLLKLDHDHIKTDLSTAQKRRLTFFDLADDPQLCYAFIAAHAARDR
ncbi:EAL domain-containing protein [Zoogloea sp.]|uniref:EAL domain-containing protein n=1 Tax=Zoogloea sp. TaxID=49181 RepID=UPI00262C0F5B|nr:EAL domain-containing protein [Zoogloea sp.]MDD3354594.1 EAL domain-containing protein [Zoogloea sp.]